MMGKVKKVESHCWVLTEATWCQDLCFEVLIIDKSYRHEHSSSNMLCRSNVSGCTFHNQNIQLCYKESYTADGHKNKRKE